MPIIPTDSGVKEIKQATSRTNNTDFVGNNDKLPESTTGIEIVIRKVKRIGTFFEIDAASLSDIPYMEAFIRDEIESFLNVTMSNKVINGNGTGNQIFGLVTEATDLTTPTGTNALSDMHNSLAADTSTPLDLIYRMVLGYRNDVKEAPQYILVNDIVAGLLPVSKTTTNDFLNLGNAGVYQVRNGIPYIGNVPVIATSFVGKDQVILARFSGSQNGVMIKDNIGLRITDVVDSDALKNQVKVIISMRAETHIMSRYALKKASIAAWKTAVEV